MTIICGDCLEVMKSYPDNHFSGVVTDPPYGLSFMGKGWDHAVPGKEYWAECLRVTKPGGFILAMGGTRTYHRLICAIEDAGWEIRDCIMWVYGSGFPKSHNKFGLEGYGTALKPAYEPIIMAMKPLDGTFKQNAERWGQAGINIDGCRIATTDKLGGGGLVGSSSKQQGWDRPWKHDEGAKEGMAKRCRLQVEKSESLGRWPANIIFDEEAGKMLDEQSGVSKSTGGRSGNSDAYSGGFKQDYYRDIKPGKGDSGGASRFFYCAKASSRERNEGLEGLPNSTAFDYGSIKKSEGRTGVNTPRKNNHPTVKPLALMRYLITLIAPPENALILDPFCGSGSTILAAKQLEIDAVEMSEKSNMRR